MSRILILVLLIVLNLIVTAQPARSAGAVLTITIPEIVTVDGEKLFLGDLGTIAGGTETERSDLSRIALGATPQPGQGRVFSRGYLSFILQQHQLKSSWELAMKDTVTVKAAATCIKGSEIQRLLEELLPSVEPTLSRRWLEVANLPRELWLPRGDWRVKATPIGKLNQLGPVLFRVIISNGTESKTLNLNGKIRATALVYRTVREILPFEELTGTDFEKLEMELVSGKEFLEPLFDPYRSSKKIGQGTILNRDQLQKIPLVKKGHEVTVIVNVDNIELKAVAVAKSDGWLGDDILVLNPASKKSFRARVVAGNTVEVVLE